MRPLWKSVLAVVAGYAVMAAGIIAATVLTIRLMTGGIPEPGWSPTPGYIAVNLLYSAGFAALGGYVTAWAAPEASRIQHAMMLAIVSLGLGIASMITEWGRQPWFYQVALLALMPPAVLAGGYLRERLAARNAAS
jgi:hypothetical protein